MIALQTAMQLLCANYHVKTLLLAVKLMWSGAVLGIGIFRLRLVVGWFISLVVRADTHSLWWDLPCVTLCTSFETTSGIGVEKTDRL